MVAYYFCRFDRPLPPLPSHLAHPPVVISVVPSVPSHRDHVVHSVALPFISPCYPSPRLSPLVVRCLVYRGAVPSPSMSPFLPVASRSPLSPLAFDVPVPSRRLTISPLSPHVRLFVIPFPSPLRSPSRCPCNLPSHPVALAISLPIPSPLQYPFPSRRPCNLPSCPIALAISLPIPSPLRPPFQSRRPCNLPSHPVALAISLLSIHSHHLVVFSPLLPVIAPLQGLKSKAAHCLEIY
ncbi:unnamed protein product [Closterium sp. NIES-64]|nr:unnamed protein product [Closterium sp. NIES-64]